MSRLVKRDVLIPRYRRDSKCDDARKDEVRVVEGVQLGQVVEEVVVCTISCPLELLSFSDPS